MFDTLAPMRSWLVVCLATALPGCAQLAGIDKTSAADPSDRLTIQRTAVGATVVTTPLDLTALSSTYLVPDATGPGGFARVPGDIETAGTWVADVPGGEPQMLFTLPDVPAPFLRLFDLGRDVTASYTVLEHQNPVAPPMNATISANVALPAPLAGGEVIEFAVVGAWVQRTFTPAELPVAPATQLTATFPYATVASVASSGMLTAISPDDIVMVLEYIAGVLTAASDTPGVAQEATTTVTGTLVAVPADQKIAVPVDPTAIAARLSAGRPAVGVPTINWAMTAAPGGAGGTAAGPTLASGTLTAVDTMIASNYGNPFATTRSWPSTFQVSARATRTYTPPSQGLPVTLDATLYEVTEPIGGLSATLPAPLPIVISIANTTILTDGLDLVVDPMVPVAIALTLDQPTATLYQIQLLELVPNVGATALVFAERLSATSRTPTFSVPPELFQPGHIYTLRAIALQGGYPNLADGDVATHSLPGAAGAFDSGVFTVVAP